MACLVGLSCAGPEEKETPPRLDDLRDFPNSVLNGKQLPIDLDNPLMADAFCQKYRKRAALRLDELYPLSGSLCVSGPEGAFRHEALVPFSRKVTIAPATSRCGPPTTAPRSFPPGSSWLYAKLYCGEASADSILQQVVVPAAHRAIERGAARQWFFIRYGDPDFHLRVRFEGDPARLAAEVLPLIHELGTRARADGRLWRVQFDTYEPEVERYGGPAGMGLAERFFHLDSELAVRLLPLFEGPGASDRRWRLATRGVAEILEALRFDLETRRRLVRKWREGFGREFRVERTFEAAIAARHRAERSQLEALLGEPGEGDDPLSQGLRLIIQHRPVLEAWARDLFAAEKAGALSATVEELAFSFGHMHANRMIHAAARAHELLIADALNRIYSSRLARSR